MKPVIEILEDRISRVVSEVCRQESPAIVRPAADAKFGDYQVNGVMAAAKKLKTNPRKLAEQIVEKLDLSDICQTPEIAGPGFINLKLNDDFISGTLLEIFNERASRLNIEKTADAQTIVVDFSGPNIAKQMHVGHLRSTILGDCICRMLEFIGHNVIRQNHIGDWGTQFGMLIAFLRKNNPGILNNIDSVHISDLEQFYKDAKALCDEDESFAGNARKEVISLHNHNKDTMKIWQHIVDESRKHYQPVYDRLGIGLGKENERGESFYADRLAGIVSDLQKSGLATESDGAVCVFPDGFKNKEGNSLPFIIRKSDGAFLYATTDLAALQYRIDELKADRIIYITDARQKLHFEMLFSVGRTAGWIKNATLEHIMFGTVLGEDGRPFKTRSGDTVKLEDLLNEAIERAQAVVADKNPEMSLEEKQKIALAVGIGAVKYADFSNNRTSDYVFSFDRMLAMDGNTAPYMQYAYARIKSISRKAAAEGIDIDSEISSLKTLAFSESAETDLAKHLLRYCEAIYSAAFDCRPNYLTSYLYELAQKFSSFYTACPVLKADKDTRAARLILCSLTASTIGHGLAELLGIEVTDKM